MSVHKKRRKVEICHNCHTILTPEDNFCSNCGQENHDLKVGLGQLLYDVFEGITNFDTKFYNTAKSIFAQPGKITKDFLEGRRARYVPPIRLYLLTSFVFFLAFDELIDKAIADGSDTTKGLIDGLTGRSRGNNDNSDDNEAQETQNAQANKKLASIKLEQRLKKLGKKNQITNLKALLDSAVVHEDSAKQAALKEKIQLAEKELAKIKKEDNGINAASKFIKYVTEFKVSSSEILDEMNVARDDTLRQIIDSLPEAQHRPLLIDIQKQLAYDTLNAEEMFEVDDDLKKYFTEKMGRTGKFEYTLILHSIKNKAVVKLNINNVIIPVKGSDGEVRNTAYKKRILTMSNDELDSLITKEELKTSPFMFLKRGLLRNTTYYELALNEDAEKAISEIIHFGVGVISFMMFILMPIVGLMLKVVYSKRMHSAFSYPFRWIRYIMDWVLYILRMRKQRKYTRIPMLVEGHTRFYYEHLIFSIHIHSVFLLMVMLIVGIGVWLGYWQMSLGIAMIGFMIYFMVSLKVVYRQGWFKTFFKSVLLLFMYSFTFILVLTITGSIKFALQ
ncbi:DUF3667 domain-containing protein [Flectobacillus major]|jgi:hypothetical protein|uniref:DUF3667 domain-containing protein n=1 Tax=Flectobacillus major TaxID=103 RepID=UPI000425C3B2|nr:DUF3667 domain-containing protein [Flectobacillus major]